MTSPPGYDISLDAGRYFVFYRSLVDHSPQLTAEEATAFLSPNLAPAGAPRLEVRGATLVYAIPVTGVDGVSAVYVSAVSGKLHTMDYHFSRQ
ncbi:MAG: hypothetical protein AB1445_03370 [Bacillota bacterium]